jgi:hypothetical protein
MQWQKEKGKQWSTNHYAENKTEHLGENLLCGIIYGVALLKWGRVFLLIFLSYRFQDTCLGKKDNCERSGILYFKVNWIYKMEIITESIIVQWQNIIYIVEAGFKGLG